MADTAIVAGNSRIGLKILDAIELDPTLTDSTKAQYCRAIARYLDDGNKFGDYTTLYEYVSGVSNSQRAFLRASIRKWGADFIKRAKAATEPDSILDTMAVIFRIEALMDAVQVRQVAGVKTHTWLSVDEAEMLLRCPGPDLRGMRDKVLLTTLLHTGLRRDELAVLTFDHIKRQPIKGQERVVLSVLGKGLKNRTVPIKREVANLLDFWRSQVGGGRVARAIGKGDNIRPTLSAVGIFKIVRQYGGLINRPDLAPHDLRRTYAELGRQAGIDIAQISYLLGHSSIETTRRYLNIRLDLSDTISDHVPFV